MPTIAIVHDAITDESSIGSIAAWDAREALERGWQVLAVCRELAPDLAPTVTRVKLLVPPRVHLVQYAAGRTAVRRALNGHAPDVVVTHQPQSAVLADIWNVHYLERAARDATGGADASRRGQVNRVLTAGVVALEDRFVGALPSTTRVLFCSRVISEDFARLYGPPADARVLPNPAPGRTDQIAAPDPVARAALVGGHRGPVLGFLGGGDPRKGGDLLVAAVDREPELFLLHAGPSPLPVSSPRIRVMGRLARVHDLLDAIDVLVVPSRFEPFGLVVVEAAARGVPVLVGPAVGAASLVLEHGSGLVWDGAAEMTPLVRELIARRAHYAAGGARLVGVLDRARIADERFEEFGAARRRRAGQDR